MLKITFAILVIITTILIILSRFLPWWGVLLGVAVAIPVSIKLIWWLVKLWGKRMVAKAMQQGARPLRGATVTIHEIKETSPPPTEEDACDIENSEGTEDHPFLPAWYASIDMTIRPSADAQIEPPVTNDYTDDYDDDDDDDEIVYDWNPDNFTIVATDAKIQSPIAEMYGLASYPIGSVVSSERLDNTDITETKPVRPEDDEEGVISIIGPARVRIVLVIPKNLTGRVKLRYMNETLHEFDLQRPIGNHA